MLNIDINNFNLENRNEIKDDNGSVKYWSQKDFAYKKRIHVYDDVNNEIGYVQYKILSIQAGIEVYDRHDNLIDMKAFDVVNKTSRWDYEITCNGNSVCKVENGKIAVIDGSDTNKCILFIFTQIEEGE